MIKLEHMVLPSPEQMEFVIEGMRNPLNSWDKSDSSHCIDVFDDCVKYENCPDCTHFTETFGYLAIGGNDLDLMRRLSKAGTDHRKFMRMMPVYVRITAPLYWWKEFDTYKVGTVANSCSTMHKIQAKAFRDEDFSREHLINTYNDGCPSYCLDDVIETLNKYRSLYLSWDEMDVVTKASWDGDKKNIWWQMIQLLPSSYNQTRNVMLNYEALANMYHSRKNHKLDEWIIFCKWVEDLPYSELITGEKEK